MALPAQQLPQFQMYQWAFVSEGSENNNVPRETAPGINGMHFYQVSFEKMSNSFKVENILKGSLDSIPSPSPSVKIQIMAGKFA